MWWDILQSGNLKLGSDPSKSIKDGFTWSLGNGTSTKFWHDPWLTPRPLCLLFPRAYNCADFKDAFISELGSFVSQSCSISWQWSLNWRSISTGRSAAEILEIQNRLERISLVMHEPDKLI